VIAFSLHSCYLRWSLLVQCFSTAYWLLVGSFLPMVASLTGCYLQWLVLMRLLSPMTSLIRFVWVSLSFQLRWLVGPYSPSGSPFCLDSNVITVCFRWLEVARDFCDGLIPMCLLSVMALSLHSCYPHWVMPIQLLPPVAVIIHNGLMAYMVATSARIVICTGFWPLLSSLVLAFFAM
jgi:hypothetical protein